ncbi:MAG: TetR/AcrR family transcriptional regulator [Bacillaceae bacterium]
MPKIVDHDIRKQQIAKATWRVIFKMGMEGATVRNIAKEANLSLGAVRHYFPTQDELLIYAMELVKEKAQNRIKMIVTQDFSPKEKVMKILQELIPTNEDTLAEMDVWLAFTIYFKQKKELYTPQHDDIYFVIQNLLDYLQQFGLLKSTIDKEIETEKLYAIIDGLALHALLDSKRVNKPLILAVITNYVDSICKDNEKDDSN